MRTTADLYPVRTMSNAPRDASPGTSPIPRYAAARCVRPLRAGYRARVSAEPVASSADRRRELRTATTGLVVLLAVLVVGLWWAKWTPYLAKVDGLAGSRHWSGSAIFDSAGHPGAAPSLSGAWQFTRDYFAAVWKALVVAIAVAAAIDALVPRRWLLAVMDRRTRRGQTLVGGLVSMPSMMCTCCTAPVAVGLRRRGVPLASAFAYWLGNPLLNPAVLAFLALVLPWQYVATRVVVGALVVFGASALIARVLERRGTAEDRLTDAVVPAHDAEPDAARLADLPLRYARSLARFALILVPEYAVVVLGLGLVSATFSDFGGLAARLGVAALVVTAVLATLLVIPTGGEIPVILAATAAGAGTGLTGVLLVALPAISLPSMVMVGRAMGWHATTAAAGVVAGAALAAGGLLSALS
jgi:uncharacterized membrane protein YraQ (UPF0718 family)